MDEALSELVDVHQHAGGGATGHGPPGIAHAFVEGDTLTEADMHDDDNGALVAAAAAKVATLHAGKM